MPTALTKPVTRKTPANVPHGCRPELCVTIYPQRGADAAQIGTRELGRAKRTELRITLGELHRLLIERAVLRCARLTKVVSRTGVSVFKPGTLERSDYRFVTEYTQHTNGTVILRSAWSTVSTGRAGRFRTLKCWGRISFESWFARVMHADFSV